MITGIKMSIRIISGKWKNQQLVINLNVKIRPTSSVVRAAIFNILGQNWFQDKIIIDLFAGTGSFGFEALSRGAQFCYFCDHQQITLKNINKTCQKLSCKQCQLHYGSYQRCLKQLASKKVTADAIFIDPPYHYDYNTILNNLAKIKTLAENGILICECPSELILSPTSTQSWQITLHHIIRKKHIYLLQSL